MRRAEREESSSYVLGVGEPLLRLSGQRTVDEGQAELCQVRATHDETVVLLERECAALVGAFLYRQCDRQEYVPCPL
jgi:hypothetical protein